MSSQQETTNTLHRVAARLEALSSIDLLCDHLEALSRMKSAEMVRPGGVQDHSHYLLEEAEAAYTQVVTLLDAFYPELAYYRQCLQQSSSTRSGPDE